MAARQLATEVIEGDELRGIHADNGALPPPREGPVAEEERERREGIQAVRIAGGTMSTLKIGREHKARKALFTKGIRRGFLTLDEIDEALPAGSLTDAERWLLFYSLHAARVEVQDSDGRRIALDELRAIRDELRPEREEREPLADEGDSAFDQ